jgi:hypothetical protein
MTDLPPPYDPVFPYAVGRNAYIDVDNRAVIFTGDDPTGDRDLYLAIAQATLCNFWEIFSVMAAIVYPHCPPEGPFEFVPPQIKERLREGMTQARKDEMRLTRFTIPVTEAFEIWARSCSALRFSAEIEPDPQKRQAILDTVAESERRMEARMELHRQRYEERKKGGVA